VEGALGDEDRLPGATGEGLAVVDHLLAGAAEDVEDLVAVRVVVALVPLPGQQHDVHEADRGSSCCPWRPGA
jgi:hypothetical protein